MNLYLRFFDKETLVTNVDDAINFLSNIPDIGMNAALEADIRDYASGDVRYPKRYKVRPRVYFIVIKTEASTMEDFKEKRSSGAVSSKDSAKAPLLAMLNNKKEGWYEGTIDFKRVVLQPATGKFAYIDTHFVARCKASSGMDCYNRIVGYLRGRVDSRSQFPSAKGKAFTFKYLGKCK